MTTKRRIKEDTKYEDKGHKTHSLVVKMNWLAFAKLICSNLQEFAHLHEYFLSSSKSRNLLPTLIRLMVRNLVISTSYNPYIGDINFFVEHDIKVI